ncbi:helix-turn-helix transcriptional regulator [Herbaspirillum lusitanum]|uniref:Helix-turn-helix transcriptional regulator n=2 Tax=Herbaspirillum lusitanum TaxID=213312 RepID=A0ABW9AE75_9BURK
MKKTKPSLSAREIFGQNLRRARRLKEISQEELAFRADISRTYLSEVERGGRNISIDNMEALALALEISLGDLINPDLFASVTDRLQD